MPSELLSKKRGRSFEAENQVVESEIQSAEFPEGARSESLNKEEESSNSSSSSTIVAEKKKEPTLKKKKTLTPEAAALLELKTGLTSCVPTSDFPKALLLVKDAIASGMVPTAHFYGILLNIATRATKLEPEVMQNALHVFQHMLSTNSKVPEASYTSMIKICALASAPEEGMRLLEKMCESGVEPRLRSYVGLIEAFSHRSDLENLKRVFEHMEKYDVAPSQTEFAHLLRVLRQCSKEEDGLSLLRTCMPVIRVLEPSLANAVTYFFSGDETTNPTSWRCTRSLVKRATGQCSVTGRTLRSIDLSSEELKQLASKCESLACSNDGARQQFEDFKRLLSARGPFDVIIDGANVGFYGQNHYDGGLCYSHIDAVVRHFEHQGLRVLVVMNDKWLQPRFYSNPDMRRPFKRRVNYYAARARGEDVDYQKIPRPTVIRDKGNRVLAASSGGAISANPSSSASGATTWEAPGSEMRGGEEMDALSEGVEDSMGEEEGNLDMDEFVDPEGGTSPSTYGRFSHYECTVASSIEEDSAVAGEIIARWRSTRTVYSVPRGNNDDWFWMYAAVSQPDPKSVRLISNDYMRDHHFHVFQEWGSFQTWRERHQVKFSIQRRGGSAASASSSASASTGSMPNATLQLRFPLPFSFRMQFSEDSNVWHFPLMKSAAGQSLPDGSSKTASTNEEDPWICAERIAVTKIIKEELK